MAASLIREGINVADQAMADDRSALKTNIPENYEQAETKYQKAIERFSQALPVVTDPKTRELLGIKIKDYGDRCAVLKQWLQDYRRSSPSPSIPGDPTQTSTENVQPPYLRPISYSVGNDNLSVLAPWQPQPQEPITPKKSLKSDIEKLTAEIDSILISDSGPPKARWDDLAGLSVAKDVLREATTIPDELRTLFGKNRQRWKSILLYGPPGCGKRVLAEAAAAAYNAPLLAPRVQDLLELMDTSGSAGVRTLFATAKKRGRAVLYIAELEEALGISLGGGNSMKFRQARAQLLDELLALRKDTGKGLLFVGATRIPWELDDALLSRVERRVYVGLPDAAARSQILLEGMRGVAHDITLQEIEDIATECEGYSPSDLRMLVRDAAMEPVRVVKNAGYFKKVSVVEGIKKVTKRTPCDRDATDAVEMRFTQVDQSEIQPPLVKCLDFDLAMTSTKPSVARETIERYVSFTEKKGQDGS